jgi:hypothetical protein
MIEKAQPGSTNTEDIKESIQKIEILTNLYKRKRMSTSEYIRQIHESLSKLTTERDYLEYLKSIGQQ